MVNFFINTQDLLLLWREQIIAWTNHTISHEDMKENSDFFVKIDNFEHVISMNKR